MLILARILPALAIALATAADAPAPNAPVDAQPGAPTPAPNAQAPSPPPTVPAVPVGDAEIREIFAGKAACPPEPLPLHVGPWEFHPDGDYVRAQDLASAHGRYAIADGKICVTLVDSDKANFCLAVLKRGDTYLFRFDDSAATASRREPVPVTPCPLPHTQAR